MVVRIRSDSLSLGSKKTSPWLKANGLRCERDDRVLFDDLCFELGEGDIARITGPNGAGKSTLIRILIGLSAGFDGELSWLDEPMSRMQFDFFSNLLYLGHQPGVKANLTPEENLSWACRGASRDDIYSALDQVGLKGYEDLPASGLSAGQHRRVALARLYLNPPKVWILDEPFTAIDKQGVAKLEQTIIDHAKNGGMVILTTHHDLGVPVKQIELGGPL